MGETTITVLVEPLEQYVQVEVGVTTTVLVVTAVLQMFSQV